jgi:hypothetical protein
MAGLFVQCDLADDVRRLVAWLPLRPALKVGSTVTLRDGPAGRWKVRWMSEPDPSPNHWRPRMFDSLA